VRFALLAAAAFVVVILASPLAQAQTLSGPPYSVAVTAAERAKTRPLVDMVLAAYRSGDYAPLCDVFSQQVIREEFGTRARCRSTTARQPRRPCRTCAFPRRRALAAYLTAADRRAGRKMITWLVLVVGDPKFERNSELELRFREEQGRWMLTAILQAG
jgi:hypothetical protein